MLFTADWKKSFANCRAAGKGMNVCPAVFGGIVAQCLELGAGLISGRGGASGKV